MQNTRKKTLRSWILGILTFVIIISLGIVICCGGNISQAEDDGVRETALRVWDEISDRREELLPFRDTHNEELRRLEVLDMERRKIMSLFRSGDLSPRETLRSLRNVSNQLQSIGSDANAD